MGYDRLWIKEWHPQDTIEKDNAELKALLEQYPPTFAQNEVKTLIITSIVKKELLYYKLSSCQDLVK
jgi:hypothetical protein